MAFNEVFKLACPKPRTPSSKPQKLDFKSLEIQGRFLKYLLNIEPCTGDIFKLSNFQTPNAGSDMLP